MTLEEFNARVSVKHRRVGHHLGRAEAVYALSATTYYDPSIEGISEHVDRLLRERLWRELYGRRFQRYHELLDQLLRIDPWTDRERQREIISELHECAPLDEREKEGEHACR